MKASLVNILLLAMLLFSQTVSAAEYQRTSSGMNFLWQSTDYVGVYTTGGTLVKYYPSSTNNNTATMKSGFGLSASTQYYAYSPYNKDNWDKTMTALPITYLGQFQQGNGSTTHLSAYDYQMTSFTTGETSASMSFSHIGALLHFSWKLPVDAKVTSLTLSCPDSKPFTTEATMDLATQTVNATATTDVLSLTIQVVKQSKGDVLNAYFMVLPTNLTGKRLKVQLSTATGENITAYILGTSVLAGHIYPIYIGKDNTSVSCRQAIAAESSSSRKAAQSTISTVTAYSPNFTTDASHAFTVLCEGDVNGDKRVSISDITSLISVMKGKSYDSYYPDVDHNGVVDINDIKQLVGILCKKNMMAN